MAYQDFAKDQYLKTVDTGEEIKMCSFQSARDEQLRYIKIGVYWEGQTPTTEQVRATIYSDSDYSSQLYQTSFTDLVDVTNKGTNWIGWIRTDFPTIVNINKNLTYYLACDFANYTRNGDISFMSILYDFPFGIYSNQSLFFDNSLQMILLGDVPQEDL